MVFRDPHGGTSEPLSSSAWWYFGTPHSPSRHGNPADLRRKRMIGISKTRGGTSGTLNMLLRWYFETPRMTVMVVLWGTLGWYFEIPCGGTSGSDGTGFGGTSRSLTLK